MKTTSKTLRVALGLLHFTRHFDRGCGHSEFNCCTTGPALEKLAFEREIHTYQGNLHLYSCLLGVTGTNRQLSVPRGLLGEGSASICAANLPCCLACPGHLPTTSLSSDLLSLFKQVTASKPELKATAWKLTHFPGYL